MKKHLFISLILGLCTLTLSARSVVKSDRIRSLQVVVNQDWLSPPVMMKGQGDVLNISFDELSHEYHRFIYHIEHCDADWQPTTDIFESDYLQGFNDNPIEDYEHSWNTNVLYTHYTLQIPNERCSLKMSGNYRLHVYDEDNAGEEVFTAEFMLCEPAMRVGLDMTTNTDIDVNDSHQQIAMSVDYGNLSVTNISEQIRTVVTQNGRDDNARRNVRHNINTGRGLKWQHNRSLIFPAGNEYRKYEILALSHPTMGIDEIHWDGHHYQVYPFVCEPRPNYLHDVSAGGSFYIRNSDNQENDITCDYVFVHYKLMSPYYPDAQMMIDGWWTTDSNADHYVMEYDEAEGSYNATIMQKQGYYSYQFLLKHPDGTTTFPPVEGSYYQTKNRYQAYVYYKELGGRAWRLVGYRQLISE